MRIFITDLDRAKYTLAIPEGDLYEMRRDNPNEYKKYRMVQDEIVFGSNAKRDQKGRPIEQGIGSPAQPSHNHVEALRNSFGDKPSAEQKVILAAEEKKLADFRARPRVDDEETV